ncbi:MAG: hypothetical protein QM776_01310 [Rhodocyclaceae bacterium]
MLKTPAIEFTTTPFTQKVRLPGWSLILLGLAYLLPGSLGHVPWRGDDLVHIAAAAGMLRDGHWLLPHVAGAPIFDAPPLHYWLGALFGKLFGWLLPLHDAIRFATVTTCFLGLWVLRRAARSLLPHDPKGNGSLLLAIGSLGLLLHAHEAQPQITLLAMLTSSLLGAGWMQRDLRIGSLILGAATGGAFLTMGVPGLILCAPVFVTSAWLARKPGNPLFKAIWPGLLLLAALLSLWPLLLAFQDPLLVRLWWHQEWLDIVPQLSLQRLSNTLGLLSWFAWPLWPVAGWALWNRRTQLKQAEYAIPLSSLVAALLIVFLTGPTRPASALPVLPALVLLAASELTRLRRGAVNWLDWFGIITFTLSGLFIWLAWIALHFGWPLGLSRNIARLVPGFVSHVEPWTVVVALALSLGWLVTLWRLPRFALRPALHWALGITLTWGLLTTLWLDWFDHDRNYTRVMQEIEAQAGPAPACVATLNVGASQIAALDYFTQLTVFPYAPGDTRCTLLVSYASGRNALVEAPAGWIRFQEIDKGRGRFREQIHLYRRLDPGLSPAGNQRPRS